MPERRAERRGQSLRSDLLEGPDIRQIRDRGRAREQVEVDLVDRAAAGHEMQRRVEVGAGMRPEDEAARLTSLDGMSCELRHLDTWMVQAREREHALAYGVREVDHPPAGGRCVGGVDDPERLRCRAETEVVDDDVP